MPEADDTVRRTLVGGLLFAGLLGSCAKPAITAEELAALEVEAESLATTLPELPGRTGAANSVVVRLAFGEASDLDLYVTDPLLETVYFARRESRSGGAITRDVRCDTEGPRVEEVRFDAAWPGRYRVGVDHPRRCDGTRPPAPAPYAVAAYANGRTYRASGVIDLEHFEVVVLEFDVTGTGET